MKANTDDESISMIKVKHNLIVLCFFVLLITIVPLSANDDNTLPLPANVDASLTRSISPLIEKQKLSPSDSPSGSEFGYSVSLYGDTALIGAYNADATGSAYVFVRDIDTDTWSQQQKLNASDGAVGDEFGYSVSLYGDTALIGAPKDDTTGSAYMFVRDAGTGIWSEQQKLSPSDPVANGRFGYSVSLDGDSALIGANANNSAYVFVRDAGTWSQQQKLTSPSSESGDYFGDSVSLDGNSALIGASQDDSYKGSAYVFMRDVGTGIWSEQQKLNASDGESYDSFGIAVSLDGDTALISAVGDDSYTGSAYMFVRDTGTGIWSNQQKLTASDPVVSDEFGISVSLDGDNALIGADGDSAYTGSAYMFVRDSGTGAWSQQQEFTATESVAGDTFGWSVSLYGDTVLIGSYSLDAYIGGAYIFVAPEPTLDVELSAVTASSPEGDSDASATGLSLLISGGISTEVNSIEILLTDGTATSADNDFSQTSATVTIPAGNYNNVQSIAIPKEALAIIGDNTVETDETLTITLQNAGIFVEVGDANGDTATQSSAIYTIINDDFTVEVLTDGGFEGTEKFQGAPLAWSPKNTTIPGKDKQKCDKPDKTFAFNGKCAFMFKGNATGEKSKINQSIEDLTVFTDGAIVMFSVYVDNRAAKVNHPIGKLIVKYSNGDKESRLLRITDPSVDGYTLIGAESVTIDLNGRQLELVKVQFRYKLTSGKFFLDDASLTVTPATSLRMERDLLPLTEVPNGFRD